MKTQEFIHESIGVTDVFGRKSGVEVVFEGGQAHTDGETITIPALPQDKVMSKHSVGVSRGYIDHESAHVRFTDWDVSKKLFKECREHNRPSLKAITNCVEDMFIEREYMKLYPGSERNLNTLCTDINVREVEHIKALPEDQRTGVNLGTVASGILARGRRDYVDTTELWDCVPDNVKAHAEKWQEHIDKIENTSDSIRLAKSIYKLLREDPNLESDPEDFNPKDDDLSDVADGDGELLPKGMKTEYGEAGEALGEALSEDGESGPAELGEDSGTKGSANGKGALGYTVYTTKYDTVLHRRLPRPSEMDNPPFWKGTYEGYAKSKSELQSKITVMKSKLQRVVASKEMRDWDFGREQGRLDSKRFSSALTGQKNIYKRRTDRNEMDTAISILVDCSGSMGGEKITLAKQVAIVLGECFEGTGVKYEIVGFTNFIAPLEYGVVRDVERSGKTYHRIEPLQLMMFKEFNDRLRDAQPFINAIDKVWKGNNSDRDAIQFAASRLSKRPESRKILFTLSDGSPDNYCSDRVNRRDLIRGAKEAVDAASKEMECIGIGILDESVERIYPNYAVVNDLDELQGTVMRKLSSILTGGKVRL
jgi:cobalamin biosynthesis protein CobT